ncbi:MAG: winged helix-turn-helix transcriptional regulator [Janthinobacterium lividum]
MTRTNQTVGYLPKGEVTGKPGHTKDDWSADAAEEAFTLLEGRWKMMIVFHLFDKGIMRFSELERAIPLASQKMLIQQLRYLQTHGVIHRTVYPEVPPKVEYKLTELGLDLRPALQALVQWSETRRKASLNDE